MLVASALYRFFHTGDEETFALRGVSLAINRGETVAVMGPSGSGKSTLLNCLSGIDEPDAGAVTIDGVRLTRRPEAERAALRARYFGILMQSGNLFQHLTVAGNLRFAMELAGKMDSTRISGVLEAVGLLHRAAAWPQNLSGGETARAGLAVVMATEAPLMLADEPTAEVDAATEERLLAAFDARRAAGLATLVSTHSEALARRADRMIRLKDGAISHA